MTCDPARLGLEISLTVKSRRIFPTKSARRQDPSEWVADGDGSGSGHFLSCASFALVRTVFDVAGIINFATLLSMIQSISR